MVQFISTTQTAKYLGISSNRVLRLIYEGKLPAEKFGRDWLLKPRDVTAFALIPRKAGRPKGSKRRVAKVSQAQEDQAPVEGYIPMWTPPRPRRPY
jgi:excisionase family DNA binding protein